MKKLFYTLSIVLLFISILGADNANLPVESEAPEELIPGESFGAGKQLARTSGGELVEVAPRPELKILPKSEGMVDPLASGGGPGKGVALAGIRALSDVIDSLDLPGTRNVGSEWNGRYIYIVNQAPADTDSASILVFDPEDGSIFDSWKLPFAGFCMGIAFVMR